MNSSTTSPEFSALVRTIAIRALHEKGNRKPTRAELDTECEGVLQGLDATLEGRDSSYAVVLDHTQALLRRAREYRRRNQPYLACVFYALWAEHKINQWIASLAQQRQLADSDVEAMIRDTQHRAKLTWLLRVLGAPEVAKSHRAVIQQLMEHRNAFVHYKWRKHKLRERQQLLIFVNAFEHTVRYFCRYEARAFGIITNRKAAQLLARMSTGDPSAG